MQTRAEALQAFYARPIWKSHRDAANETMIDSDNVLLLRPISPESGFALEDKHRLPVGATKHSKALIVATIYYFDESVSADLLNFFEHELKPCLPSNGASILASFTTEASENTFPALPVREGENAFVLFSRFHNSAGYEHYQATLTQSEGGDGMSKKLASHLKRPCEVRKLSPTARSLIAG